MATFSSGVAQDKLLARFQSPLKRRAPEAPPASAGTSVPSDGSVWVCQWREPQARKHKTWQGDAVLTVHGALASLRCTTGKMCVCADRLVMSARVRGEIAPGNEIYIGGKEVLVRRC